MKHCQFDVGAYIEASTDAIITNDNSDRTHPCIYLGPSGNRQGSHNCFSLDTGRVVVRRSAKQMPWPDRLLKVANSWGTRGKHAIQRGHLKFLNRNGEKFDWENDDLANLETDRTEEKLVHPDFVAEIPGIETEADYENIVGPQSASQGSKPTVAQRVAAARQSAGRDRSVTVTPRGVNSDDDEVSATSVIDLTDDDLFLSGLPMSVKQEMVNEDSINHISDGGVHIPGQERVNKDSIDHLSDGGVHFSGQERVNAVTNSNDPPPRMEECVGVEGTRPRGRCMFHRCKGNRMLMKSMMGLGSPR